jgi:bleomycin hydrolase
MDATKRARLSFSRVGYCLLLTLGFALPVFGETPGLREEIYANLAKIPHPTNAAAFHCASALPAMNQGKTFICWSFATSSFVESEMARLKLEPVRLSVIYPLYYGYLEKARLFIQTKGESRFAPGDLFTGVPDLWQKYGAVPVSAYERFTNGMNLNQTNLYDQLDDLMAEVKRSDRWDEGQTLSKVKKLLNRYLGEPPKNFSFKGKTYTPLSFLREVVRLPWNEYVMVTSFENAPFNTFAELQVPDNWHHNTNFFNVPLPLFYDSLKGAVRSGYTVAVSADTSEPSYKITGHYCFVPDFDIAPAKIDQHARELRFFDGSTTDDHAIHIVGWADAGGEDWFIAKDSSKSAWRDGNQGEMFLHSSYVKLKVLAFIVHRDGVPELTALMHRN